LSAELWTNLAHGTVNNQQSTDKNPLQLMKGNCGILLMVLGDFCGFFFWKDGQQKITHSS